MKKYLVIFCQGRYSKVDYETEDYDQALEVREELTRDMMFCGERDFYYIIKEVEYQYDI